MEGTVAADYNRVMMSYACSNEILNDKNEYKSFARINPSASSLISATIEVLKQNNWNKFSILYDVNYITIVEQLVAAATKENMTINHKEKFIWMQCTAIFRDTKASTRIYLYVGHPSNVNKLLLTMAMTGIYLRANKAQKYMLIYMDNEGGYEPKKWRDYIWNSRQRSYYTQFDFEYDLMNYYKGFMIVANRFRDEGQLKSFTEKVNEYNIKEPFCLSAGPIQRDVPYLSAAYLYDSVILYANVVREIYNSMAEGNVMDAASNGSAIVSKLKNKTYESILGYNMTLNQNAQSEGEYSVYLLDDCPLDLKERLNETCSKCLVKIGDYEPEDDIPLSLEVDLKYILDEPTCGYVNPTCQTEEFGELRTYVSFYLGVCLVFFLFTSIILYWKRRLIQKNCWGIQKK